MADLNTSMCPHSMPSIQFKEEEYYHVVLLSRGGEIFEPTVGSSCSKCENVTTLNMNLSQ